MKKNIMIVCIMILCLFSVFSQTEYSVQVDALWMGSTPLNVEFTYSRDYTGTATTPFTIGPYSEPFTVTLTIQETHLWAWAAELQFICWDLICGDSNPSITVTADQIIPTVSLMARYVNIEPTPPTPTIPPSSGYISLSPADVTVYTSDAFSWEIHANTGTQKLAAYGIEITWPVPEDGVIMTVDTSIGNNGIEVGADGFLAAVSVDSQGWLTISGFDVAGVGPSTNLHLLTAHFIAGDAPVTSALVTLYVDTMVDETTATVGAAQGMDAIIRIEELSYGDVNQDGAIDIIDALLVAQYYVALNPAAYTAPLLAGDANADRRVDIVDALMIAQYYVGICNCPNLP